MISIDVVVDDRGCWHTLGEPDEIMKIDDTMRVTYHGENPLTRQMCIDGCAKLVSVLGITSATPQPESENCI